MFENSKFALGFAGVTLVGAALFAGLSDYSDTSKFDGAPNDIPEVREAAVKQPAPRPSPKPAEQAVGFAEDEMLIDDANGFSPEPREIAEIADSDNYDAGDDDTGDASDDNASENAANSYEDREEAPPRRISAEESVSGY